MYYKEDERICYIDAYGVVKCRWMYHVKCGSSIIYSTASATASSLSIVNGKGVCYKEYYNGKAFYIDEKDCFRWVDNVGVENDTSSSVQGLQHSNTSDSKIFSITIKDGEVWLTRKLDDWGSYSEIILDSLYDNSSYSNVFLSDDGENIVYREKDNFILKSISTGNESSFPNMEFITHSNGHRPLISLFGCRIPRMIDPITRQAINGHNLPKYKFISQTRSIMLILIKR